MTISITASVATDGFAVLRDALSAAEVAAMRGTVIGNLDRMACTRPNPASRHLAGFHRVPALEGLHRAITANPTLNHALAELFTPAEPVTIGLSDITVNRSQDWHTDLLRGPYAHHLSPDICWADDVVPCVKALVYLQDGRSLKVRPGSHLRPLPLDSDTPTTPQADDEVAEVAVRAGDIVVMDIRLIHRGSTEADLIGASLTDAPKILVSTVFGADGAPLARAMELGNAHRLQDWDARHLPGARTLS